jgi:hypothetical protein
VLKKGDNLLMKIGDRFKDKITGKVYILRMVSDDNTLWLEGENGLGRRLTGVGGGEEEPKRGLSVPRDQG